VNILIIDAFSAQHIGNAALLDSTLEQLKNRFPQAQFTILAFDPDSIAHFGYRTIEALLGKTLAGYGRLRQVGWVICESMWMLLNTLNFCILKRIHLLVNPCRYSFSARKRSIIKAYLDADIVISISGESLQDRFWKAILFYLYAYWMAHKMGKVVAIFPQSIGPITGKLLKLVVRYVLNRCDLVLPRDYLSLETVQQLGIYTGRVHLVPDVAVNQRYLSSSEARQLLTANGVKLSRRPLVGVTISIWKEKEYQQCLPVIKDICHFITEDLKGMVVLFSPNMPIQGETSDWELAQSLYRSLTSKENVILLSRTYTPREFKGMMGELDLFISTRMHASILATMMATPTITVNTQPKLRGYMEMIHQQARACEVKEFTIEKAKKLIEGTLKDSDQVRQSLTQTGHELRKQATMAAELLKEIYDRKRMVNTP